MNYKSFNLGDWIGHINGVIEDESELDGDEMRDLVEFLTTLKQEKQLREQQLWKDKCIKEINHLRKYISNLETQIVEQEQKTGQWIEHVERDDWDDYEEVWYECDQCHTDWGGAVNFCPNCGAKMVEDTGSEG